MTESQDFYLGILNVNLPCQTFDLGDGVTLSRTYAALIHYPMMAFSPPAVEGQHHPAPWKPLSEIFGGTAGKTSVVQTQLCVPGRVSAAFEDTNTPVNWITALLCIIIGRPVSCPFGGRVSFDQMAAYEEATASLYSLPSSQEPMVTLSVEQLNYLASWRDTASLVKDDAFSFACEAYFHSHSHAPELRFMTFWFILERLFLRDADELAYRLSANVAAFLEQSGEKRYDLFRKVKRLYKIRSAVAHGRGLGDATAIAEADEIVIRCLRRVVENRRRPTQDDLFKLLFGAP